MMNNQINYNTDTKGASELPRTLTGSIPTRTDHGQHHGHLKQNASVSDVPESHAPDRDGDDVELYDSFESMGLQENLLRGIYGYGFEAPSLIQQKAIVPTCCGHDIVIHSQSGTGKSATFSVGMLQQMEFSVSRTQGLILSPTRDLALQTQKVVLALGDYLRVDCHASIGGRNVRQDAEKIRSGPHIITGTPGRILDNIHRRVLNTRHLKCLVMDEVDVMLSIGFRDAVYEIVKSLPQDCQIIIVSATFDDEVHTIASKFLREPIKVLIPQEKVNLKGISQFYVDCGYEENKVDVLLDLYATLTLAQTIVFVNSRRRAQWLTDIMNQEEHTVSCIHGEMSQFERDATLQEFVQGASRVLIATDVVARGIDIQQVSAVMNFELPYERANYIHRIGRGGRFGRQSIAINLITDKDHHLLKDIEHFWSVDISEMPKNVDSFLK